LIPNEHINYKILAEHFSKTQESMRLLYRKFEKNQTSLWLTYVKAYNFDMGVSK